MKTGQLIECISYLQQHSGSCDPCVFHPPGIDPLSGRNDDTGLTVEPVRVFEASP